MWHGHVEDLARLVYCLAAHCTCGRPMQIGTGEWHCSAHQMLADQHTLDHLAFARGMRQHFLDAEWVVPTEPNTVDRELIRLDDDALPLKLARRSGRARPKSLRTLAYALVGLLIACSLSAPFLAQNASATPPIAAWQTR
jgi:hypothetical protein